MLGIDSEIGTWTLRLWVAAGSAALLAIVCMLAFALPRTRRMEWARSVFVVLAAVLGAALTWALLGAGFGDPDAERRALELRAEQLGLRALAPGSPLACLDSLAGESVEAACEKMIFASPATVAAATSFVAERFALLSDLAAYAERGGVGAEDSLVSLRRSLEADRFGFLAHLLAMHDGCTGENCKPLALLRDPSRVRANLSGETLERYLEHYLFVWAKTPESAVADATPVPPNAAVQSSAQGPHKVPVNIDFPTAASIPPVNIMNPEPTGPVLPGVAAAAAANPNPPPAAQSSRRSRKQAANPPAQAGVQAAAAPSAAAAPPVEPVWEPAPAQSAAPASAAPVQLNPFLPAPEASGGATVRAQ
ncbi:MAG TPA: hypothetical protein VK430_13380 [Xanthobacteraceae bacterium]|nr:hypothetical protein [Xanthobacteraceae bacterium]